MSDYCSCGGPCSGECSWGQAKAALVENPVLLAERNSLKALCEHAQDRVGELLAEQDVLKAREAKWRELVDLLGAEYPNYMDYRAEREEEERRCRRETELREELNVWRENESF